MFCPYVHNYQCTKLLILANIGLFRSSDVHIAVMGVTGAGKSSFISLLSDKTVAVGHDLQACTQSVDVYACKLFPGRNVYLIDTPGFDDTKRSDTEVLRELA